MIKFIKRIFFVYIYIKLLSPKRELSFNDLNFRNLDFTNYEKIKSFIFKPQFYKIKNKYVNNFDFLNYSKRLGGKIGINLSKKTVFNWYNIYKNKINYPWSEELVSIRLINLLYNYEYINSSSTKNESNLLNKIIYVHLHRVSFEFNNKRNNEISSHEILAYLLSCFILNKINTKMIDNIKSILSFQIDNLGMHKSYNILEHSKFINNLKEIKNILLFFKISNFIEIDNIILKSTSILNQYFHYDGTIPLFNGSNNNYTNLIYESINKETYLKKRSFDNIKNGIAFYSDERKKLFFDVVQPNKDKISSNLSAGSLAIEVSGFGEKIITNCGASESFGQNPEYLRYSAAHSTIVLQNTNISEIRENNPHIKFPQLVEFGKTEQEDAIIFEGSHNGYKNKFNKIIKRKLNIQMKKSIILGEDSIISLNNNKEGIIYHIRFHLYEGVTFNFTNGKKNVILRTKNNNIWLFKSDNELIIEDSILVDRNKTKPTKQIVIKGIIRENKLVKKWSLEKI